MLRRFLEDRSANFAVMTALLSIPLLTVTGLALDSVRAALQQQAMQTAADGAVLAAASSGKSSRDDLNRIANDFYRGNLGAYADSPQAIDITLDATGQILLKAQSASPLTLGKILYPGGFEVLVRSAASKTRSMKTEIALVLDTSYSMSAQAGNGRRIDHLASIATKMFDVFHAADPEGNRIKVGVVPFSRYVNVGTGNRGEGWINLRGTTPGGASPQPPSSETDARCQPGNSFIAENICARTQDITDGISLGTYSWTCTSPDFAAPQPICNGQGIAGVWHGCVGSRTAPDDLTLVAPSSSRYPALADTECGAAITPLTNYHLTWHQAISSLQASDETYIAPGILWGWNILTPEPPFTEAAPMDEQTAKIMIVLTDGLNTKAASYPAHASGNANRSQRAMQALCTNVKNAGVTIYTIAFGPNDPAEALANCASSASTALSASDEPALEAAFEAIASKPVTARLTM